MGVYQCCADNGIPPAANATFNVEVQCEFPSSIRSIIKDSFITHQPLLFFTFPPAVEPLIRVRHQNMTAANGTTVVLECEVILII